MNKPDAAEAWESASQDVVALDFLGHGGAVGDEIRGFPWETTSLGPIEGWPLSLKTILRVVLSSRQTMCFWWGPDLLSFYNDAYVPILGKDKTGTIGQPFAEVWEDVWYDVLPFAREALAGRGTWMEDLPLKMTRNGYEEDTWWTFSYSPLYGDDGRVAGILNIVTETTKAVQDRKALATSYEEASRHLKERERYEEELRLLNAELAHRMKNTLAMTTSIVSQTLKDVPFAEGIRRAILGRVTALSKAQDVLTSTSWQAADLKAVVEMALAPHIDRDDRFSIVGDTMLLPAQRALSLALSVHELATNATKYGALSEPEGRVHISWAVDGDRFSFHWQESQGPEPSPPSKTGFGSRILRYATPAAFAGSAEVDFGKGGLQYRLYGTATDRAHPSVEHGEAGQRR